MMKLPLVLVYTAMTFLAWGVYGILLNYGQKGMGGAFLKPFVGVGFAYFVIAVLGAGAMLGGTKEKGHWSFSGTILSLIAGSVGALGALGVILALAFGGEPVYVMPLIFGGAPVVNTLFTSWLGKTFNKITPLFVIGMILVGVGMVGVLSQKPHPPKPSTEPTKATSLLSVPSSKVLSFATLDTADAVKADLATSSEKSVATPPTKAPNYLYVVLSIVMAIVCWGSYGPVLHLGQMKMGGSRLRPFCCVGLAYFLIAVLVPLAILSIDRAGSTWTLSGMLWSIAAGTAGAIGALGIILAFNYGGKPIFVMPLVFGFAPVINTLTTLWISNQLHKIDPLFAASLATVIAGAVMVLVFAPKAKHGPPAKLEPSPTESPAIAPAPVTEPTASSSPEGPATSDAASVPSPSESTNSTTSSDSKPS
jgi:MFS family permease